MREEVGEEEEEEVEEEDATPLRAWGRGDISGVLLAVGA